jgi:ABC-type branched-subunit amino acid transport system ATPase component
VVDRLVAIAGGRKLLDGDPREVMASPVLRDVYLGEDPL